MYQVMYHVYIYMWCKNESALVYYQTIDDRSVRDIYRPRIYIKKK